MLQVLVCKIYCYRQSIAKVMNFISQKRGKAISPFLSDRVTFFAKKLLIYVTHSAKTCIVRTTSEFLLFFIFSALSTARVHNIYREGEYPTLSKGTVF